LKNIHVQHILDADARMSANSRIFTLWLVTHLGYVRNYAVQLDEFSFL